MQLNMFEMGTHAFTEAFGQKRSDHFETLPEDYEESRLLVVVTCDLQ